MNAFALPGGWLYVNAGLIVAALANHKIGTARKIRGWTGLSRDRCQRLLDRLQSEDRVALKETVVGGNSCDEYHLADAEEGGSVRILRPTTLTDHPSSKPIEMQ